MILPGTNVFVCYLIFVINRHPILRFFFADRANPMQPWESYCVDIFLVAFGFNMASRLTARCVPFGNFLPWDMQCPPWEETEPNILGDEYTDSLVFITLPILLLRKIIEYIMQASELLEDRELQAIEQHFHKIDEDRSGTIELDEFAEVFRDREVCGLRHGCIPTRYTITNEEINKWFVGIDSNHNMELSIGELRRALHNGDIPREAAAHLGANAEDRKWFDTFLVFAEYGFQIFLYFATFYLFWQPSGILLPQYKWIKRIKKPNKFVRMWAQGVTSQWYWWFVTSFLLIFFPKYICQGICYHLAKNGFRDVIAITDGYEDDEEAWEREA